MKFLLPVLVAVATASLAAEKPHIFLVMADDQGWGQTGYNGHPRLKTPNLDEMAANGLRFDRFYAGASNCSPSRATVLTGRSNDRTGVYNHGFPLRLQEKTIAQALRDAGYATGHFGKWHLNGLRGPGVPVLASDTHHPGAFGFDFWITATNYFDVDPLLGRMGEFIDLKGDSSEVAVNLAMNFFREKSPESPVFAVIWFGSPHDPMIASAADRAPFADLPEEHQHHLGELVALDRSIGALRSGLQEAGAADDTIIWYCSDNGGLKGFDDEATMGGLRGSKNTMYEGGLRVPGILEWPARIPEGRTTTVPAGTVDIFPTIAEIVGLPDTALLHPQDGISLVPLLDGKMEERPRPIPSRHDGRGVLIGDDYKLLKQNDQYELYRLTADPAEETNLVDSEPDLAAKWISEFEAWNLSVEASKAGADYPDGRVSPDQPERRFWYEDPAYDQHLDTFWDRPEYRNWRTKHERAKAGQK